MNIASRLSRLERLERAADVGDWRLGLPPSVTVAEAEALQLSLARALASHAEQTGIDLEALSAEEVEALAKLLASQMEDGGEIEADYDADGQ